MKPIRHFLLAVQFFTRIPITGSLAQWVGFSEDLQVKCLAYLPFIGLLVGGFSAAIFYGFVILLPNVSGVIWIAALMSVFVSILMTGALHEDGLADLADGLGGGSTREAVLRIMKDSRIGTFGAIALFLILFGRVLFIVTLAQIDVRLCIFSIIAAAIYSRFLVLVLMRNLIYVGDIENSKSKGLISRQNPEILFTGTLITCLLISGLYYEYPAVTWFGGFMMGAVSYYLISRILRLRLGGFTGDTLGATQQISEVSFYLGTLMATAFI
jgi:adenosylcobinamide-GDP ribazoletransferase